MGQWAKVSAVTPAVTGLCDLLRVLRIVRAKGYGEPMRRRMRFSGQLLLLQLAVVAIVVGIGFGLFGWQLAQQRSVEYGQRALAIARALAADPQVRAEVQRWAADDRAGPEVAAELLTGPVQLQAEAVRAGTGALFVVVTDDRGIRLSHPDPDEVGRMVSTDPSIPLAGREEIVEQTGTLGESARAKVPVMDPAGETVVGAVSVGIATDVIERVWRDDLALAAVFAVGALGLGAGCAVLLTRRLRRLTLGLEPEEMTALVAEHEAVLGGIADAVVAVDPAGRITVANDESRRLLGAGVVPGVAVDACGLPSDLTDRITGLVGQSDVEIADGPHHLLLDGRILVWTARGVRRSRRSLGVVLSVRDRTDIESLARELDAARTVSSALRAQRHEFANRLHVVHGLVATQRSAEATEYLEQILGSGPLGEVLADLDTVADPTLQAFLSAKAAQLREKSVVLRLGSGTWLPVVLTDPVPATVALGNLLDNAAEAVLRVEGDRPRWVEVELVVVEDDLHLTVTDNGPGVPEGLRGSLFRSGVSTGGGSGRGLGLALVHQVSTAQGGSARLADPGGDSGGATFHVVLPLRRPEPEES